jgi:hypothetical protein
MNERMRADGSARTAWIAEEDRFVQVRREDRRVRARRSARGRFAHSDWRLVRQRSFSLHSLFCCSNEGRPQPAAEQLSTHRIDGLLVIFRTPRGVSINGLGGFVRAWQSDPSGVCHFAANKDCTRRVIRTLNR